MKKVIKKEMNVDDEENNEENYICDVRGNFIIHKKGCMCCKRIINGVSEYTSTVTGEIYKIDGHYMCETNNCKYLVTCRIFDAQYVGKTITSMRERHRFHRYDIKANRCGLGAHFFKHAEEMGINMDSNMDEIMKHLNLIIITSTNKCSAEEWQDMEADIIQSLKTTQEYGGMNIIFT